MDHIQSYADEYEAFASFFKNEYSVIVGAPPVAWENVPLEAKGTKVGFVQFSVLNGEPAKMTFGAPGANVTRHPGVINVNIFLPVDQGKMPGLRLGDKIASILRRVSIKGIIVREPAVRSLGDDGIYFQVNVSAGFQRDSLF